jgi:hypothetical protein
MTTPICESPNAYEQDGAQKAISRLVSNRFLWELYLVALAE